MSERNWDVIIVGAGSSGAVLASRLSEEENRRVLLLEAGDAPENLELFPDEIRSAHIVAGARPVSPHNWRIPGFITSDREYTATRGRILGGSSATNGGYFIRPRLEDFASWETSGSALWGYEHALPIMRAMETDLVYGATDIHGDSGPIPVSRTNLDTFTAQTFVAAAHELGIPDHQDMNDQGLDGVGPIATNTVGTVQYNSAMTYLTSEINRPNLTIWANATVERVLFSGTRATGARIRRNGEVSDILAGEVVLSAGALATPQLLMLSGIGPEEDLARLGVGLVHNSPGVGQGLSDHPQLFGMWMPTEIHEPVEGKWMGGVLHTTVDDALIEIIHSQLSLSELVGEEASPANSLMVAPITGRRTGELKLTSASIEDAPTIYYHYLENADVRADLRAAARLTHDFLATETMTSTSEWSWGPPTEIVGNDRELDIWIQEQVGTSMHACATASWAGNSPVVDPEGNVLGVSSLRIADTSILPAAPRRGPAATAILIGEVIAEVMRSENS